MKNDDLKEYHGKRDFKRTAEPAGEGKRASGRTFVVQKHAASHLHFDFRLELDGVLKSWAVPKGPSIDPHFHRLAIHVEDHPVEYGSFEGTIPQGEYGGGAVMIWDKGVWEPIGNAEDGYRFGKLKFELHGERLRGKWTLVRLTGHDGKKNWLLNKSGREPHVGGEPTEKYKTSVVSGRTMDEIAANKTKSRRLLPTKETAPFPKTFSPQLATLVDAVPTGDDWLHEIKFDGYRILCFIEKGRARLVTRNGKDWTARFPVIAQAMEKLGVVNAIVDGEVVVKNSDGTTDFQSLQNYLRGDKNKALVYEVFDLPYLGATDLTSVPLRDRKEALKRLLDSAPGAVGAPIHFSNHIVGQGKLTLQSVCEHSMEGIISKRADSPYVQDRSSHWVKVKCVKRQEFVIGGFTAPKGSRRHFGSLLVGTFNSDGQLVYCGHVGTGFNAESLTSVYAELRKREQKHSPFASAVEDKLRRVVRWTSPALVAEVEFIDWTDSGFLRHPSFLGLREDKNASDVRIEEPKPVDAVAAGESADVRLTHPDRVVYPGKKFTKRDVAVYYAAVSKFMLPHLRGRPVVLVRCPQGLAKTCFFQKHADSAPDFLRRVPIEEKHKRGDYLLVDDAKGLAALVQMGVLEIHVWGSTAGELETPDRLVFDLDPAPSVRWEKVVLAAKRVKQRLEALELRSFVKTTGGKGLHVVAPILPELSWKKVEALTRLVAESLARDFPGEYVSQAGKKLRSGKIFIDYLRNARGATSVCAFSTRARPGAPVSMPLRWEELERITGPRGFDLLSSPKRMASLKQDPWDGFFNLKQAIPGKIQKSLK